jgi:hypothetical protein
MTEREFAPPAPPLDVSQPMEVRAFMTLRAPEGWNDSAHAAPARQFMIVRDGVLDVSAGGETRRFTSGDVLLVEDTSGFGHGSTVIEELTMAVVRF